MPKLLYSNETHGCGATIKLDSQETCMVSCAQSGVLVKSYRGRFGQFWINFCGSVLYNERIVSKAAETAMALEILFPVSLLPVKFENHVLNAFANAIWQCSTATEVSRVVHQAANPEESSISGENIHFQGNRGSITFGDKKPTINLFEGADGLTVMHGNAYLWVDDLVRFAEDKLAPQRLKDDAAIVRRWLGNQRGALTPDQREKFAQGFVQYLREGRAPSPALQESFNYFKAMPSAFNYNIPLDDTIRGVMARLLAV